MIEWQNKNSEIINTLFWLCDILFITLLLTLYYIFLTTSDISVRKLFLYISLITEQKFLIFKWVSEKWTLTYLPSFSVRFMVFNATFSNISAMSWLSVLLVDEIGVPRENHRPATDHWQTWSHNVASSTSHHERDSNSQL